MFYYILFVVFVLLTAFALKYHNRYVEKTVALMLCFILIVVGTIRWKTGFDWIYYMGFFKYIEKVRYWSELKVGYEPIYTSLNFLSMYLGWGFVGVQFFQILIITSLKYLTFKRFTPYYVLAIFFNFCFFPDIVTVRNFLAASVILFGLRFVVEKRPVAFILVVLIAANIHASSTLAILFYPIYHWRISMGVKALLLTLSVMIGLTGLFGKVLDVLADNIIGGSGYVGTKLSAYSEIGDEGAEPQTTNILIVILGIARRLIVIPILFYFENKYFSKDKLFKGVCNLFIFGNIIYFIVGNEYRIFQRLSIPFYLCEVLLWIWIFAKVKIKSLFFLFLVLYGFSKYYYIYTNNKLITPYISIFDYDTPQERWDKHHPAKPFE